MDTKLLKELGFEAASAKVEEKSKLMKKMHTAYNNYEFVTPESIDKFNERLKKETLREGKQAYHYKALTFTPIKEYTEVPPQEALERLKEAKERKCFDSFEVAKISDVKEVKDPILFGRIKGCGDRFFIAQWDDDVTLEMIKNTQ